MARILVADDDTSVLNRLSATLSDAKHEVERAVNGEQAYALLKAQSFHVLITDLRMPRLDGMELLRRIRAEQPEVEVVVLTGRATVGTAVEAMKLGAFDYLQKPFESPDELRLVVERALERRGLRDLAERVRETPAPRLTWGAPAMAAIDKALRKFAETHTKVLLLGETGTGKGMAALFLHNHSARAHGPFVAVNCAVLSEQLLESDLFGHEKGAFTGAIAQRRGKLELAEGGTLFLDEVGELKPELQAKLLRALQEGTFERRGGTRTFKADVRWIAATNRDLATEVSAGRFREDLYYRLAVCPIELPPLRERREDIPPLADALMGPIAREIRRPGLALDESARQALRERDWPGNVRELENVLERAAIFAEGLLLSAAEFERIEGFVDELIRIRKPDGPPSVPDETIDAYCYAFIVAHQDSATETEIARRLGMTREGLYKMRKRLGIPRSDKPHVTAENADVSSPGRRTSRPSRP